MGRYSDFLLTADFDRTITAPDSTIPERNLRAIREFIRQGGTFTMNTGRSVPMYRRYLDVIPVNAPLLLYNGSADYNMRTGKLCFCHEIPLDLWQTIREVSQMFPDLTVELQGERAHYRFRENPMWDAFCAHNGCTHAFAQPGDDLGPFLKFSVYGEFRDVTVADLFNADDAQRRRMDEAEELLRQRYGDSVEVFRAATRILDIHAKGVSKIRAARELQHHLGKKYLVCVGDAENDIPMLEGADFAYCPADGIVADRFPNVCECGKGAVADVIERMLPKLAAGQTEQYGCGA